MSSTTSRMEFIQNDLDLAVMHHSEVRVCLPTLVEVAVLVQVEV